MKRRVETDLDDEHPEIIGLTRADNLYKKRKSLQRRIERLEEFLDEGQSYSEADFSDYDNKRRELLITYFRGRFSPDGTQPIQDYTNAKIYTLFINLRDSVAKKILSLNQELEYLLSNPFHYTDD